MINKFKRIANLCKSGKYAIILYELFSKLGIKNIVLPLPISLIIEPTNACNLHCPTCPTGSGKINRPVRMMSFEEFKKIIDQVKTHVDRIYLYSYGEPFLNKELLKMTKYAVSAGIYVEISTNGLFFKSREFCLELFKADYKT